MVYFLTIVMPLLIFIPLGMKWEIKLKIVIPWSLFVGLLSCATLYFSREYSNLLNPLFQLFLGLLQTGTITVIVTLIFFFRDPERIPPPHKQCIISPADGTVVYVKKIKKGEFPFAVKGSKEIPLNEFIREELITGEGVQIGIGMNLLNVHVNRTPIKGKIKKLKRIPGGFFSLKKISSLLENERVLTIVEGNDIEVGIVQIASRLVRRIRSYLNEGEEVSAGQRLGIIRFGSQVDILIPMKNNLKLLVSPREEVKAGESIIATY